MNQPKKYGEWKKQVGGFLGKDFWHDFSDFFSKDYPSVNIYESFDKMICLIEIPGLKSVRDVKIFVHQQTLTIKGEVKHSYSDYKSVREELFSGDFNRQIELPRPVHSEPVDAVYEKGLLKIVLQRLKESDLSEIVIKDEHQ